MPSLSLWGRNQTVSPSARRDSPSARRGAKGRGAQPGGGRLRDSSPRQGTGEEKEGRQEARRRRLKCALPLLSPSAAGRTELPAPLSLRGEGEPPAPARGETGADSSAELVTRHLR